MDSDTKYVVQLACIKSRHACNRYGPLNETLCMKSRVTAHLAQQQQKMEKGMTFNSKKFKFNPLEDELRKDCLQTV